MKILFAVQGTGNGHISRARSIYPELQQYGDVDVLLSGYQADVTTSFPIAYRKKGLSFIFGKHGGISVWETAKKLNAVQFLQDIRQLPVEKYDVVINDFEPLTSWACKLKKKKCYALSHQSAVLHPDAPHPKNVDVLGKIILKNYAPYTSYCGFHFKRYDENIYPPVIRNEVQELCVKNDDHYTVYLPAYDDKSLIEFFSHYKKIKWHIFSKHNKNIFENDHIKIEPIENTSFLNSLATSAGCIMGAGFEGPSEAIYLGKKLLVIPMKGQYEQQCNAAALASLGIKAIDTLNSKNITIVSDWIDNKSYIRLDFPKDTASQSVKRIMELSQNE